MWQAQTMQADFFFYLLCSFGLLESHHKSRQGTNWISTWASYSTPSAPASFLSSAESLALSFRHLIRSRGDFLFCFFPQISASLPVKELGSSVPGCLFPNLHCCLAHAAQAFLQSRGKLVWETHLAGKYSPPPPRVSCQQLLFPGPGTTWSYRLLEQERAVAPGCLLLPLAWPAVPAVGVDWTAVKEERSVSPDGRSEHFSSFLRGIN